MKRVIGIVQEVQIVMPDGTTVGVMAKIDTGAHGCSISQELAIKILSDSAAPLVHKIYASALGRQRRPVYPVELIIRGERVKTEVTISQRRHLTLPMLIGVRALQTFLIDPSLPHPQLHRKTKPCS